ncbi:MAG: hypothetical protein WAU28_04200 [Candidatus Moraniibacteriota bacterium]
MIQIFPLRGATPMPKHRIITQKKIKSYYTINVLFSQYYTHHSSVIVPRGTFYQYEYPSQLFHVEQLINTYSMEMFHVEQNNLVLLKFPLIKGNATMKNRVIFRIWLLLTVPRGTFTHGRHSDDVPRGTNI